MIDNLFIHKCDIQKRVKTQGDRGGQVSTWQSWKNKVRCRLDMAKGQEISTSSGKVVKATHTLYLMPISNIAEEDNRIVVDGNNYDILMISKSSSMNEHHLELYLQRVF